MRYYISPPPVSPLARVIASVFAVLAVIGAAVLGLFMLAALIGFGLLAWLVLTIRRWWVRRRRPQAQAQRHQGNPEVIEAEYTVISRRRD